MNTLPGDISRIMLLLALAGVIYDRYIVDVIERNDPPLGVTAWEVVGGVLFTLAGAAFLIGVEAVLVVLACFAASGIPMILGSRARHLAREG